MLTWSFSSLECLAITWKSVKEELMKSSELQKYQVLFYEVVKILAFDLNAYAFEGRIVVSEESLQQLSDTTILDFVPSVDKRRLLFLLSDFANDKNTIRYIFTMQRRRIVCRRNLRFDDSGFNT